MSQIARELESAVERELQSGERTVWVEMPVPRYFTGLTTTMFLFGIPWTAFALFWTGGAAWGTWRGGPGFFRLFPLFGLPFILIGFGMLGSPIWAYRKAQRTIYAITDRRALIIAAGRTTTIRSFPPEKLEEIFRREKRDGTGDVIFLRNAWRDSDGDRRSEEIGFMSVREPKHVENLLQELAQQKRPPKL